MGMKKKKMTPPAFAEATKDTRFAGTFEVFVPVEGRARPHRVPLQFQSKHEAETWIHSEEGIAKIAEVRAGG